MGQRGARGGFQHSLKKDANANHVEKEKKVDINEKRFEKLFTYSCEKTKNKNISAVDLNPLNPDLLVACYGGYCVEQPEEGMICLWTLKSPKYPERIIKTPTRLTSCKFSARNPNLVATGDYDGVIAIYDIRSAGNKPVIDSRDCKDKHIDVVWEVQWISKGTQDNLVSISSDGRIVEWTMKKKLESSDLMQLKR